MSDRIYIADTELERLRDLVDLHAHGRDGSAARRLAAELERAIVLAPAQLPADVVTVGSRVVYRDTRSGSEREVTVEYPSSADPAAHRISVLAPIGAALIGLRRGDRIEWPLPDGRTAELHIVSVSQPDRTGAAELAP